MIRYRLILEKRRWRQFILNFSGSQLWVRYIQIIRHNHVRICRKMENANTVTDAVSTIMKKSGDDWLILFQVFRMESPCRLSRSASEIIKNKDIITIIKIELNMHLKRIFTQIRVIIKTNLISSNLTSIQTSPINFRCIISPLLLWTKWTMGSTQETIFSRHPLKSQGQSKT